MDPAYVNRLERAEDGEPLIPSRKVAIGLWHTLAAATVEASLELRVTAEDRDRLLSAAGYLPQVVVDAGGWDAYLDRIRAVVSKARYDLEDALRD